VLFGSFISLNILHGNSAHSPQLLYPCSLTAQWYKGQVYWHVFQCPESLPLNGNATLALFAVEFTFVADQTAG
jgi:hypothetical protein